MESMNTILVAAIEKASSLLPKLFTAAKGWLLAGKKIECK